MQGKEAKRGNQDAQIRNEKQLVFSRLTAELVTSVTLTMIMWLLEMNECIVCFFFVFLIAILSAIAMYA